MNQVLELYLKTKKDWDKKSSVRSSGESYDLNINKIDPKKDPDWHVSNYSGILQHEKLSSLTEEQKKFVMGTQLLEFVIKTTKFEIDYVNVVANNLALGKYYFKLPEVLKLDALKIYTDEGFHAHFSLQMSDQIKKYYKIDDDLSPYLDGFFEKLNNLGNRFDKNYKYLSLIAAVIVSESMIVQDISNEMKDVVYEPIRAMFKDHMIDEAFHANYFGTLFKIIWPQLLEKEKEILGINLCEAMKVLGAPRVDIYYYSLPKIGFDKKIVSKFISDIYDNSEWNQNKIKKRMSNILKLLNSCGVFEISSVKKEFSNQGLI